MTRKVVEVTPRNEGKWAVQSKGSQKAAGIFANKCDAIQKAKNIAKNASTGQVKIHLQNGKLQTEYTYRNGPVKHHG